MVPKRTLIDLLAELYETQSKSRRVIQDAGLDPAYIEFKDNANDNWYYILIEARKRNKLEDIVESASKEYRERESELRSLLQLSTLETSASKTISGRRQALSRQRDFQVAEPGQSITSPIQFRPQFPSKEPVLKEPMDEEDDVLIGRELHWDRILVAKMFLNMIKRQNEERPLRVLGIQAHRKEGLDSLVNRFEEMCKSLAQRMPLIYAQVSFLETLGAEWRLAQSILNGLRVNARQSEQQVVMLQTEILEQALSQIDLSSATATRQRGLTGYQLCQLLTACLEKVAKECVVALLLSDFDQLRDSKGEWLQSSKWLRDMWLPEHARTVKRLVILITGDRGLDQLAKIKGGEIFCFHPDHTPLPAMSPQDFEEWARDGFGFKDLTYEQVEAIYKEIHGSPKEFAKYLKLKAIEKGVALR